MIAKNHCLMKFREKGRYISGINEKLMSSPQNAPDVDAIKEKDNTLEQMSLALLHLNKEQQVCVTLFYLEKKSYHQVAAETGYSLIQVKSNIQNGKRNLKIQMERLQQNER